ncbi:hypothetical protein LUZ60_016116 [Juncus effusus]|nr:hypothetical protein LUZ60_016116 [Juncus effusus]
MKTSLPGFVAFFAAWCLWVAYILPLASNIARPFLSVFPVLPFTPQIVVFIKSTFFYFLEWVYGLLYSAKDKSELRRIIDNLGIYRSLIQKFEECAVLDQWRVVHLKELKSWCDDARDVIDLYGYQGHRGNLPAWSRTRRCFLHDLAARVKHVEEIYDKLCSYMLKIVDDNNIGRRRPRFILKTQRTHDTSMKHRLNMFFSPEIPCMIRRGRGWSRIIHKTWRIHYSVINWFYWISVLLLSILSSVVEKIQTLHNRPSRSKSDESLPNQIGVGQDCKNHDADDNNSFARENVIREQSALYGRGEVQQKVLECLNSKANKMAIIPIVGPGGVGKTALAHSIYSHPTIPNKFDMKGWANCGSFSCDLTYLMKNILDAFTERTFDSADFDNLKRRVQEEVLGRRFLLVLDNVSKGTLSMLCDLCALFFGAHLGKIVVTTREKDVASFVTDKVELEPSFVLGNLDDDDSWFIFRDCIDKNHGEMKKKKKKYNIEVGKQLALKCEGLPLSIRALGSSLRFESCNKENWQGILADKIWKLDGDDFLPALKISYSRMDVKLKRCFVLLSMFPEGHVFCENDVVRLWMSLDLIQKEEGGKLYLNELLERSMIELAQDDEGNTGFTMHDLMHDLVRAHALDDFMNIQPEGLYSSPRHVRYLSILVSNSTDTIDLVPLQEHRELRVLQIVHQKSNWKNDRTPVTKIKLSNRLFQNMEHLKALVMSMTQIEALPDSIGNLKLLRYLDLKNTGIETLPNSICGLYYLQTLDVTNCPLRELPEGINDLVNLEYLIFEWELSLCMPRGIGQMKRLRVLPRFDIKKGNWHCVINELKDLEQISGKLCIAGLGNVAIAEEEAREALLQNKHQMKVLRLDWSSGPGPCPHVRKGDKAEAGTSDAHIQFGAEHLFERLKPCTNLETLHMYGYPGVAYPSWLGDVSFHKLVKISLVGPTYLDESVKSSLIGSEKSCETLPPLGGLPSLKALFIKSMWNVLTVGLDFHCHRAAFPSLKILRFHDMLNWVEWHAAGPHAFKSLQTLTITDCPKLERIPYPLSSSLTKLVSLSLKGKLSKDFFRSMRLPSLRTLKICFSGNLRLLPLDSKDVPSLEMVVIHRCRNLQTIVGLAKLESLQVMKIHACENLQFSLNEELPPRLTHLAISCCSKLERWKQLQKRKFHDQLQDELGALAQLSETDTDADDI